MVHLDVNTCSFEGCHPAVNLRLRDPPIRLRHLVALHQETLSVRARSPEHYTVNQDVVGSIAAEYHVADFYCTRLYRLHQQEVAITHQRLHAGSVRLEAQALAEVQDLSAQQGEDG
jgi:hypothetical protein